MPEDELSPALRTELQTIRAELHAISSDMQAVRAELLLELEATRIELPLSMHTELQPLKDSIREIQREFHNIRLYIEGDLKPMIKQAAESRVSPVPEHKREDPEIAEIRQDIRLIKAILAEHSELLNRLT